MTERERRERREQHARNPAEDVGSQGAGSGRATRRALIHGGMVAAAAGGLAYLGGRHAAQATPLLPALTAGSGFPAFVPSTRRQPNVLFVTIDTIRTDRTGPGGALAVLTPTLDRLAAEGIYANAYVQLPQTAPNHATMLTGAYVQTHGLRTTLWDKARSEVPTLDQLFRAAGYRTAAITSWFSFDHEFTNLLRAWDTYEQVTVRFGTRDRVTPDQARAMFQAGEEMSKEIDGDARTTTEAALRWLDAYGAQGNQPWFFWLHYRDPHYPFTPPPPYDTLPPMGAPFDGGAESVGRVTSGYEPTSAEMARLLAAYDGEIAYTDAELGRVVERLNRLGIAGHTIVVVTGDHGESFLEQGPWDWLHGHSVYEAAVRVPLVVRYPAEPEAVVSGRRLPPPIQSADIAPTLLELCRLPVPATMEGRPISSLLAGQDDSGPPRAAWGTLYDDSQNFVVTGEWKLVRWNEPGRREADELYHLASDPGETHDYSAEVPEVAAELDAMLSGWLAEKDAGRLWKPWEE